MYDQTALCRSVREKPPCSYTGCPMNIYPFAISSIDKDRNQILLLICLTRLKDTLFNFFMIIIISLKNTKRIIKTHFDGENKT